MKLKEGDNMEQGTFKFHVWNLSNGWCNVRMLINDKLIAFDAEYMGQNPLASLIDACAGLMENEGEFYCVRWQYHDVIMRLNMDVDENSMLHLYIVKEHVIEYREKNYKSEELEKWDETIPFSTFVEVVRAEGFRVLNAFGLWGYRRSWMNHEDFPLTNLLRITFEPDEVWNGDSCCTLFSKELECLQEKKAQLEAFEERKMDLCTIYYESWQLQCCGDPFSVGDKVEWTGILSQYQNAHGIIIDFDEEHHGFATLNITGTITRIIAERSEFPKGGLGVSYEKAKTIKEDLQHANGWESDLPNDETTERTFWGYIVELEDVIVTPLKEKTNTQ